MVGITASASDADATSNTITYSLDDDAGGRFTIAASGVITVADGSLLDREAAASHGIVVRATSADGSFSTQAFTIGLTDVDEFDVGAVTDTDVAANVVNENAANGMVVGITALAADSDATNNTVAAGGGGGGCSTSNCPQHIDSEHDLHGRLSELVVTRRSVAGVHRRGAGFMDRF